MTAATARRLDTEAIAQSDVGTYRQSQSHGGHGCCQDAERFGPLARAQGRGARSLIGFDDSPDTARALVMTLRCRSWRCRCCAVRLRRRARARAFMGASGHKVALVTLTIDPSDPRLADPANRAGKARPRARDLVHDPRAATIETSTRYAAWAWNRLTSLYRYRHGRGLPFFKGLELQRSGMAHLHVLVRVRDAADFLALRAELRGPESDRSAGLAVMAGFGLVVDAQLARSGGDVARYVTKAESGADAAAYATKGVPAASLPRYTRRTAWSVAPATAWAPGWVKPTPIAGFTWRVARASESTVRDALALSDYFIDDPARYRVGSAAPAAERGSTWLPQ